MSRVKAKSFGLGNGICPSYSSSGQLRSVPRKSKNGESGDVPEELRRERIGDFYSPWLIVTAVLFPFFFFFVMRCKGKVWVSFSV